MVKKLQALRAKKGFTLVELIVVIAIIGVLAAILVPTMMNVVTKARVSSSDQTAKSLADSVTQWLSDLEANRGTIPNGAITIKYDSAQAEGSRVEVTYLDSVVYKRNGQDNTGSVAKGLLEDDIETNYPFKGGEFAIVVIDKKHVAGCAYSDDGAESGNLTSANFTAAVFASGVAKWESSSKEGITGDNNIIGTNPKLLYSDSATLDLST